MSEGPPLAFQDPHCNPTFPPPHSSSCKTGRASPISLAIVSPQSFPSLAHHQNSPECPVKTQIPDPPVPRAAASGSPRERPGTWVSNKAPGPSGSSGKASSRSPTPHPHWPVSHTPPASPSHCPLPPLGTPLRADLIQSQLQQNPPLVLRTEPPPPGTWPGGPPGLFPLRCSLPAALNFIQRPAPSPLWPVPRTAPGLRTLRLLAPQPPPPPPPLGCPDLPHLPRTGTRPPALPTRRVTPPPARLSSQSWVKNPGSAERNVTGAADHRFLTGRVLRGSHQAGT